MARDIDRHYTVDELLDDPVARTIMAHDGIDPDDVRRLIQDMRVKLGYAPARVEAGAGFRAIFGNGLGHTVPPAFRQGDGHPANECDELGWDLGASGACA